MVGFVLVVLSLFAYTALSGLMSTAVKQAILDIHNELRDRVASGALASQGHPAATDMNELIWDEGLEKVAQDYMNSCPPWGHNANRNSDLLTIHNQGGTKWGPYPMGITDWRYMQCGENLSGFWGDITDESALIKNFVQRIEGWYNEYKRGTFYDSARNHYTQVVWANTRYIGCAYKTNPACGDATKMNSLICNYYPPGNYPSFPYTAGESCSDCMSDRSEQCTSHYDIVSPNKDSYSAPYNSLCGGGVCPDECDGSNHGSTDCNDGTISLTSGRNVCNWSPSTTAGTTTTSTSTTAGTTTTSTSTTAGTTTTSTSTSTTAGTTTASTPTTAGTTTDRPTPSPTDRPTPSPTDRPSNRPTKTTQVTRPPTKAAKVTRPPTKATKVTRPPTKATQVTRPPTKATPNVECVTISNFDDDNINGVWISQDKFNGKEAYKKDEYWLYYSNDGYWAIYSALENGGDDYSDVWDLGWCEGPNVDLCDGAWEFWVTPGSIADWDTDNDVEFKKGRCDARLQMDADPNGNNVVMLIICIAVFVLIIVSGSIWCVIKKNKIKSKAIGGKGIELDADESSDDNKGEEEMEMGINNTDEMIQCTN